MLRKDLVESKEFPGFYLSTKFPNLAVSLDGRIIDIRLKYCLVPGYNGFWEYPTVNVRGYGTQQVHRVVAETLLIPIGDPDHLTINHKDGCKENSRVNNLEWSSHSDNANHAYKSGLRPDNRPVEVEDLLTGEREVFYSLQAASRSLGINAGNIRMFLKTEVLRPLRGRFNARYVGDVWKPLTVEHVYAHRHELDDVVSIRSDGAGFLCNGLQSAIIAIGCRDCKEKDLRELVNQGGGMCQTCSASFVYANEFDGNRTDLSPFGRKNNRPPTRKPKRVRVTNTVTGETEEWSSVEEFAKSVGSNKNTIQRSVYYKGGRWRQYKLKYLD